MRMSQAFPTKYINAGDLQKQRHTLTIANIVMEEGIDKPIIYFHGRQKGLACNKTNAMMIASLYGDETDNWIGQKVELYEAQVMFDNKFVPAIRVQAPPPSMPAHEGRSVHTAPDVNAPPPPQFQSPSAFAAQAEPESVGDLDDSIPF